ncbi:MAG: hypothetical protein IJD39_01625 [Clostridia bacterium]|nr:hypothetical protein [Clostridia bacterium]
MRRKLLLIVSLVLALAMSLGGTIAYLSDTDSAVNVMTLGSVKIVQLENGMEEGGFEQGQPLYPAYIAEDANGEKTVYGLIEKEVTVKNVGSSDAYVRTIIAFEAGDVTDLAKFRELIVADFGTAAEWLDAPVALENGSKYFVAWVTYPEALAKGEVTAASLVNVYMNPEAGNEDVAQFDGMYEILALSQAMQTVNFEDMTPGAALDVAFGSVAAKAAEWLAKMDVNGAVKPFIPNAQVMYNGIVYDDIYAAVKVANAKGGGTLTLMGSATLDKPVEITADITIDGDGCTLTRDPGDDVAHTAAFTGNMIVVKNGATLTLEDTILDGEQKEVTGSLVVTEANSHIVLNEGAVLKNNYGAHAVSLGTRIGATLTLNGGEIVGNSSDSGAIWGGGHITVNSGKINNNSSTGSAGAIRMVSNCNLTMNGGEISNNTAAGSGGAIYGYGASTYNFNGGKMNGNKAAVGGAMYTGDSSTVNISGDFEMCGNTADDAGALRLSNRTSFNMTGGKLEGNESTNSPAWDGFYGWNPAVDLSAGELNDDIMIQGGLTPTVGGGEGDGVIHFALSTNHNTANLKADFKPFKFTVAEGSNFAAFNLKPAAGYTYTAGDEEKLTCMNEGYATYWDAEKAVFKIKAE